jgi:hypothetical protein
VLWPFVDSVLIVVAIAAGAFATVILDLARKMPTTTKRLKHMFPGQSAVWYARVDFILVWVLGSIAAYFLYGPQNSQQGFIAGLGCVSFIRLAAGRFELEKEDK